MIALNICGNNEVLGISDDQGEQLNFADMLDAAESDGVNCRMKASYSYWNGGPGYKKVPVAVTIDGYGTVLNLREAVDGVSWLARNEAEFPSSEEIATAFETAEKMAEEISEMIKKIQGVA